MRYALVALITLAAGPAWAHTAPTGWAYPIGCCANVDCREVNSHHSPVEISEGYGKGGDYGYIVSTTLEFIGLEDRRLKQSPDGSYHWCSTQGKDTGRTICLYVPPKGF